MESTTPKKYFLLLALFIIYSIQLSAQSNRPIGSNLSGIQDWSTEYVFVDVFKMSRDWISHDDIPNSPWSSNVNIPLNENGYPLEIPYNDNINPPQLIRTLMYFAELEGNYPSGSYRLMASGTGVIRLWGAASGTFNCPVDTLVSVDSELGGIALEIEISKVEDPIHDIRFIMPGFENNFIEQPFNPDFIDFISDFEVLRFMDWMKTNDSPLIHWNQRRRPDYYTQTLRQGIAYEYIIELCNLTKKDAWICIPHGASDDFIKEMAQLFKDGLDPSLKLYIEYSNEVWNSQFEQSQYADQMGANEGYSGSPWEQGWKYYAKRTADMFQIFEDEFQGNNNLIKIISSQAANSWVSNFIIERFNEPQYNPTQVQADALAIAPYFGGAVANNIGHAGLINSTTVEAILDSMELSLPQTFQWMDDHKTLTNEKNLELMAYEGGQHLVASWQFHNDEAFVTKLKDANRHERMESMYCDYFDHWYEETLGGIFAHFSSHGLYSKYGSWGVKEFMEDTLSPKYTGLQKCVFSYNPPTGTKQSIKPGSFKIFPNPTSTGLITINHNLENPEINLYNLNGQLIPIQVNTIDLNNSSIIVDHFDGVGILQLKDNSKIITDKIIFIN